MPFQFITNKIHTGKPVKSIDQLLKEAQSAREGQVKTASVAAPAPTGEVKEAAFPKGHEDKFKANADKVRNKGPADKPEKGEENDACDDKKASTIEVEVKLAAEQEEGVETYDAGKKEGTEFANDSEKKPEDAPTKATGGDKKPEAKNGKDGLPTSGQPQWEGEQKNNNNPWKDPKAKDDKKAVSQQSIKLAVPEGGFQIVANMTPKLKKSTKDYWRTLFGEDYADAMVADK